MSERVPSLQCQTSRASGHLSIAEPQNLSWMNLRGRPRRRRSGVWWSQTGSNRRPHACKARALPTELWPRRGSRQQAGKEASHTQPTRRSVDTPCRRLPICLLPLPDMVGLGRLERPTSPLSGVRSNHLSYRPSPAHAEPVPADAGTADERSGSSLRKKEKRGRRRPAKRSLTGTFVFQVFR
jgi:hypothetical protein